MVVVGPRKRVDWTLYDPKLIALFREHGAQWERLRDELRFPSDCVLSPKTVMSRCKSIIPTEEYLAEIERARVVREMPSRNPRTVAERERKNGSRSHVPPCGLHTLPLLPSLQLPLPVIDL